MILIFILLQLSKTVLTKGMVGTVEGVVGYPVIIPCDITPPAPGDSPHLILWYKNIFGTPIYSVDGRNGIEKAKHWGDSQIFENREDFYIDKKTDSIMAYLRINNTKISDSGPYRCRVDFWKAATRNFKISVNLATPAETVEITNEKGKVISGIFTSSRVEGTLNLTCTAKGGNPKPSLIWKFGEETMTPNLLNESANTVSSSVNMKNLKLRDSGKKVTCLAKNNNLYPAPSASTRIEIVLAPIRVEISRTISTFVAGSVYNITCQVLGSNPTPATALWVKGKKLKTIFEKESADGKMFTIVAEFRPTTEHDGEFIRCTAKNQYLPKETLEDQWNINIIYAPIPLIHIKAPKNQQSNRISVKEGEKIILDCQSMSNPKPFEFHWRLQQDSKIHILPTMSSNLIIDSVNINQTGYYTCLAENIQGIGESPSLFLEILFEPKCKTTEVMYIDVSMHESTDLSCEMKSNPGNLSFQWFLHKTEDTNSAITVIDVPSTQFTQHERKSVLTLTPRTPGDFGRVSCTAKNSIGQGRSCDYIITRQTPTPGVHECDVSVEDDAMTIICEPDIPQENGIEYEAELFDKSFVSHRKLSSKVPTFRFLSVDPKTMYTIKVSVLRRVPEHGNEVKKFLKFSQVLTIKEPEQKINLSSEGTFFYEDQMLEKVLPLIGVSGILIFAFIIVMIVISIVRRTRDLLKDKSFNTHIAFNQGLDQDISTDVIQRLRPGIQRIHSLDQLNQITFEGFGAEALKASLLPKYNTLPIGGISVVSVTSNPETSIVKRVTFAKGTTSTSSSSSAENSSSDSVRTIRDRCEYMNLQVQNEKHFQYEESTLI